MKLTKCVKLKLLIPYMDIIFEVVDHIKGLLSDIYTNSVFDDQDQNEQVKTFYDKYTGMPPKSLINWLNQYLSEG